MQPRRSRHTAAILASPSRLRPASPSPPLERRDLGPLALVPTSPGRRPLYGSGALDAQIPLLHLPTRRAPPPTKTFTARPGVQILQRRAPPDIPAFNDLVIHQQDIRRHREPSLCGGAEAMTNIIRCIGNVILVDRTSFSPSFVIQAIGDPQHPARDGYCKPTYGDYQAYVSKVRPQIRAARQRLPELRACNNLAHQLLIFLCRW